MQYGKPESDNKRVEGKRLVTEQEVQHRIHGIFFFKWSSSLKACHSSSSEVFSIAPMGAMTAAAVANWSWVPSDLPKCILKAICIWLTTLFLNYMQTSIHRKELFLLSTQILSSSHISQPGVCLFFSSQLWPCSFTSLSFLACLSFPHLDGHQTLPGWKLQP